MLGLAGSLVQVVGGLASASTLSLGQSWREVLSLPKLIQTIIDLGDGVLVIPTDGIQPLIIHTKISRSHWAWEPRPEEQHTHCDLD